MSARSRSRKSTSRTIKVALLSDHGTSSSRFNMKGVWKDRVAFEHERTKSTGLSPFFFLVLFNRLFHSIALSNSSRTVLAEAAFESGMQIDGIDGMEAGDVGMELEMGSPDEDWEDIPMSCEARSSHDGAAVDETRRQTIQW